MTTEFLNRTELLQESLYQVRMFDSYNRQEKQINGLTKMIEKHLCKKNCKDFNVITVLTKGISYL